MRYHSVIVWLAYTTALVAAEKYSQYGGSPPVYPSPNITGIGGWEDALKRAKDFVNELTLEEKAGMVTGTPGPCVGNIAPISRLNFTGLCLQDGPLALRQAIYASIFSAGLSASASWDRALVKERSALMASEFKGKGSHVILGPVVGPLGRSPFGGRNWEGFSPDAYLSGVLVEESVKGIQEMGVQACTKHFIMNEQESQRNPSYVDNKRVEAISSNIDDKTIHETYLWPFANALRAGTASIMCSYQRINGSYGCQNSKTMNGLLKEELGFQGYVMSDWGGTRAGIPSILAGLDMNMPGGFDFATGAPSHFGGNITLGVNNGSLAIEKVDDMVLRIMTPYYYLKQDVDYPDIDESTGGLNFFPVPNYQYQFSFGPVTDVRKDHASHIRKLGAAGTVLLKNTNNALPLKEPKNIGVFGNDAADFTQGLIPSDNYDIGTLAVGGGSGTGRFTYVVSPLEAIKTKAESWGALVQYITSNSFIRDHGLGSIYLKPPDVCLVFLKSWAAEGSDRSTLIAEWDSTAIVEKTAALCPNTVVVLHGASPNTLPWRDNANVTAILAAHMPGQETGNSIVDILWGTINPSGKLPYTIARQESDYSKNLINSPELVGSTDPDAWQTDFTEGSLIDYKEFDYYNKSVAYEFGFGLSYTTFELSDIKIDVVQANPSRTPSSSAEILPGGNRELWETLVNVTVTVKNTGKLTGATVPQLYASLPAAEAGDKTPVRSLRGFEKVELSAGESKGVVFGLMRRDLSFWDTVGQTWRLPAGKIGVSVGFSSRDLGLEGEISV
ncbi:glycoside hydrolase family 3 protein [Pleomassaria siparia CBS 279.74]|uniref:Probable beta-glucosidase G n=1 Tax=Pleomassaria siparia CBS 279.74 TaxID=1314801 RepID=A0A6G1KB12_9PLEO|nr:glycoside hydrolase family 3 protein [Pleomassaria siparia CBS 279.74]